MIHMPHRSVTRFFVPLIDVLLLLFCIFLLMPLADEAALEKQLDQSYQNALDAEYEAGENERTQSKLDYYMKTHVSNIEMAEILRDYERLKNQNPNVSYNFQQIEIDKKGLLWYRDPKLPKEKGGLPINNAKVALELTDKLDREAKANGDNRKLYLFFIMPRPQLGYPTNKQIDDYRNWFKDVKHSLPAL